MKISGGFIAAFAIVLWLATLGIASAGTGSGPAIFVDNFAYLTAYPIGSDGDVMPAALNTDMAFPDGIAKDAIGRIYVTNTSTNTVTIYPAVASGNVAPLAVIGGSLTQLSKPTGIALDGSGTIYVLNTGTSAITVYPALGTSTGILDAAPVASISGRETMLAGPTAIAVDESGDIYVANQSGGPATPGGAFAPGAITIYSAGSNGNVAPSIVISGAATGLVYPVAIAVDSSGVYVVNSGTLIYTVQEYIYPASVTVYSAGSGGNAKPSAVITGTDTALGAPQGIALDSDSNIYTTTLTATGSSAINVYAAGGNGDVAPSATIVGADTGLNSANGIALDSLGNLYLSNKNGGPLETGSVTVYPAGSNGDATPTDTITSNSSGISLSEGVAVDAMGKIYITNAFANSVNIYAAGSYGTGPPIATIAGSATGLNLPLKVALDAQGDIAVLNIDDTINVYRTGSIGNVPPNQTVSIDRRGDNIPIGIAMAADGKILLANQGYFKCNGRHCHQTGLGNIAVFPAGSKGKANPSAIIGGSETRLAFPAGIAVSNRGKIYVANQGAVCSSRCGCVPSGQGSVTVYARGSNGNVKPITTIKGPDTGLGFAYGIAVDSNENIYVLASRTDFFVAPPICTRFGSVGELGRMRRAQSDVSTASGDTFILPPNYFFSSVGASSIVVFKAGSHGDAAPIATIDGPFTSINGSAIAVGPAGN